MGTRESPAAVEGTKGGAEEEEEDDGVGVGVGLADRASCNACRDFSKLAMTALWSVWMQFNLGGQGGRQKRDRERERETCHLCFRVSRKQRATPIFSTKSSWYGAPQAPLLVPPFPHKLRVVVVFATTPPALAIHQTSSKPRNSTNVSIDFAPLYK